MSLSIKTKYIDETNVKVVFGGYVGNYDYLAIQLFTEEGECLAKATVFAEDYTPKEYGYTLIKDYSENEGLLMALIEADIVKPTGYTHQLSQFAKAYEVVINPYKLEEASWNK